MIPMRYFLFPALLAVPALTFAAELTRVPAASRITAVTVYSDRALTTRSVSLNLKPGSYLVAFDGLPTLIQDDSVRVAGKGSAEATIVGLEVKRVFLEQSGEKRVKEIDEEIRGLEQRADALDARKAGLASQKAFFESIRVAWGERISKELAIGRPTSAELLDAAGIVGTGVSKAEQQTLDLERDKKSIRDRIDSLRRQRDESIGSLRKETKTVEVMIDTAREGNLTLNLATVISRAGWVPAYDFRLAGDAGTAELTFRAMVRQQTGEDWNNVDLTLSTARPATGAAPPELNPWHISFPRPQPLLEQSMAMNVGPAPAGMMRKRALVLDGSAPAEEAPAAFETAQINEEQASVSFHIPRPLDIPSDGSQHGTVVAIEQLPVTMEFMAIPKLSPFVFLKSEIINKTAYPLLPGKVSTFTGNTYTGSSQLKKVAAGEKFDLFFGVDDQVTVKREEQKQHREAGVFGKNQVRYGYRIELNNFRREPLTVTLHDQLPLAGDKEIKVSLEDPSIKPDQIGTDGRITWRTTLTAQEKKVLTFGILIEYPKDREVTGL